MELTLSAEDLILVEDTDGIKNIKPVGWLQPVDEEEQAWLDDEVAELLTDLGLED